MVIVGLLDAFEYTIFNYPGTFRRGPGFVEGVAGKVFGEQQFALVAFEGVAGGGIVSKQEWREEQSGHNHYDSR
jgi:hypothetical protein